MIIRQFSARHGRSVFAASSKTLRRTYASDNSIDNSVPRQSGREPQPERTIPAHLEKPSSHLDPSQITQTPETRSAAESITRAQDAIQILQAEINAVAAEKSQNIVPETTTSTSKPKREPAPYKSLQSMYSVRKDSQKMSKKGSAIRNVYHPWTIIDNPPTSSQVTLPMLLANQTHLGHATALWNPANSGYIFGSRDGIHIISLEITLSYLRRAAKVIQEVARRGGLILFIGTRKGQQDIILNAAKRSKGYHIFDRWIPGSLTNSQQILGNCAVKIVDVKDKELTRYRELLSYGAHQAVRPDLVVCLNPLENEVCLHECGLNTVPTIGVIDTDANPSWVTYPIPANDDSLRSVALIAGALSRAAEEGQMLRMKEAAQGRPTYAVHNMGETIERIEEIASLSIQESRLESEKDAD